MTDEPSEPKRRGRPPAPEEQRRRHNLTLRIRSDLREKIEIMAQKNGRSLSEEVEFIIETQFREDRTLKGISKSLIAALAFQTEKFKDTSIKVVSREAELLLNEQMKRNHEFTMEQARSIMQEAYDGSKRFYDEALRIRDEAIRMRTEAEIFLGKAKRSAQENH